MTSFRSIGLMALIMLLSACASLQDFQQMDTRTRTEFVCERDSQVRYHRRQVIDIQGRAAEIQQALLDGYRLVETCTTTTIEPVDHVCMSTQEGGQTMTTCADSEVSMIKQVCRQTPVAIDGNLEKQKRQDLLALQQAEAITADRAYMACFNKVGAMTPEQAFQYHQNN